MKHLTLSLLALPSSLLALHAAVPIHWDVDLAAQPPQVFALQRPRGETYELEAILKNRGKPFEPAITNACIYWQTNGMENLYWSAPASVSNNVLRATWLPSMDPGAATVRGYIGDPGHIYAAAFQFRFIASPGELPNVLPLPVPVIDFAKVTVLNPPWSGGGGGGVDTNAVERIANRAVETNSVTVGLSSSVSGLESSKRDTTDESCYTNAFSRFEWVSSDNPALLEYLQNGGNPRQPDFDDNHFWYITVEGVGDIVDGYDRLDPEDHVGEFHFDFFNVMSPVAHATAVRAVYTDPDPSHVLARRDKTASSALAKFDAYGNLVAASASDIPHDTTKLDADDPVLTATAPSVEASSTSLAGAKATGEALKDKADEFTEWKFGGEGVSRYTDLLIEFEKVDEEVYSCWLKDGDVRVGYMTTSNPDITVALDFEDVDGHDASDIIATRKRVLRTGDAATPQDLTNAISTNNPAFVSAVRNTPTSGMPEDMPTDWGTYGTVGAALAALAAFVKWAKAKIVAVIGDDGKPTDTFATDLLEKQVAITAIDARIKTNAESAAEPTNAVTINDNAPKTVTVATATSPATPSLAVTFGTARNGGLRICELYILNGTADTDLTFDSAVNFVSTGDSFPACEAGINYFVFAEVAANLWKVTRETLKSITTPTPVAAA